MSNGVPTYVDSSLGQPKKADYAGKAVSGAASGAAIGSIVPGVGTLIGGALGALGGIASAWFTDRQNKRDRKFQVEMYDKANAYNAPRAQMERLRSAGLNPNLAYGNLADSKATAINPLPSKAIPMPNVGEMMQSTIGQIVDLQQKRLQNDNLEVQTINALQTGKNLGYLGDKAQAEIESINHDIGLKTISFKQKEQFYRQEKDLYDTTVEMRKQKALQIQLENAEQKIKNSFLPKEQQLKVYESYGRLKMLQATANQHAVDIALKQEALKLRKQGVEVNDNFILRFFSDFLQDVKLATSPKSE